MRPERDDRDYDQGTRSQGEHRDEPGPAHLALAEPHGVEKEDEGQGKDGYGLQSRVLRAEREEPQALLAQGKAQAQEDDRERQRRPLHDPRREGRDREHHGDEGEGRQQVGQ